MPLNTDDRQALVLDSLDNAVCIGYLRYTKSRAEAIYRLMMIAVYCDLLLEINILGFIASHP